LQLTDETPIPDETPGTTWPWLLPVRMDGGPSIGQAPP
jgi:hypothetical protein